MIICCPFRQLNNSSSNIITYEVDLYKDNNNSLGMSLMGDLISGIFIKSVHPIDGSAARSGKIQTGEKNFLRIRNESMTH